MSFENPPSTQIILEVMPAPAPIVPAPKLEMTFAKMCAEASVTVATQEFFLAQGILCAHDLAILASSEAEVKTEIIDPILGGGVELKTLSDKGSVRKLWSACKKIGKASDRADDEMEAGHEGPIPPVPLGDLEKVWHHKHGFVMPDGWLLTQNLTGKMWRALVAEKPYLEQILAESLRLRLSPAPEKPKGSFIAFVPGESPKTHEVIADGVSKPVELYTRIRAWFNTMAFVCVKRPDFFDFATAILASEKVLTFCTQTFDGAPAHVSHYVKAWAATVTFFSEHVKADEKNTLKGAILMTASWEHRWTSYQQSSGGRGSSGGPDLPKHILDEMRSLKEAVAKWQGVADKANGDAEKERSRHRAATQQQQNQQQQQHQQHQNGKGKGKNSFAKKNSGGGGSGSKHNNYGRRSPSRRGGDRDQRGADLRPRRS